jgi:hypothetical protein
MSKTEQTYDNPETGNSSLGVVMPRFLFGEWVLVDKEKSGQIIECYGNSCIVDENGMWTEYQKERLIKDTRYLTPAEYYESNGA